MDILRACLEYDEGREPWLYDDATAKRVVAPLGKITGGVGHNFEANPLSSAVIDLLLDEDLAVAIAAARSLYPHFGSLSYQRQHALTMMAFQIGKWGLSKFFETNRAINSFRWARAAECARDSLWAREQSPNRAARVIRLFEREEYDYPNLVGRL